MVGLIYQQTGNAPSNWSLPHSLHFSQPTQSMMEVMLRKCVCSCRLRSPASALFHIRPSWKGMGHALRSASLFTCYHAEACSFQHYHEPKECKT